MVELSRASISAVCIVDDRAPEFDVIARLLNVLGANFSDAEIVIVANGCDNETTLHLKALTEQLPDITVAFLETRLDADTAKLVGIENAIGDWVLFIDPMPSRLSALPALFAEIHKGIDVVLALPLQRGRPSPLRALLQRTFISFYNWLNGVSVLAERPVLSLLSRQAALHVLHCRDAEMLLRSRKIGSGFPSTITIADPGPPPRSLSIPRALACCSPPTRRRCA
jgi:glycosyltransferase involved in cell wall biosynthesis